MIKLTPKQWARFPAVTLALFGCGLIYFAIQDPFEQIIKTVVWQCAWIGLTVRGLWHVRPWAWWSAAAISAFGSYYALTEVAPGLLRNLLDNPGNPWSLYAQWPAFIQTCCIVATLIVLLRKPCRKKYWAGLS